MGYRPSSGQQATPYCPNPRSPQLLPRGKEQGVSPCVEGTSRERDSACGSHEWRVQPAVRAGVARTPWLFYTDEMDSKVRIVRKHSSVPLADDHAACQHLHSPEVFY